jgi:GAF domain-containing protein
MHMSNQAVDELTGAGRDRLLLQALARLNEIGASINRLTGSDVGRLDAILQLIVESAIKMAAGASAVLYIYDPESRAFDPVSRVSAGERGGAEALGLAGAQDEPRPFGLGMRAVTQLRSVLSYEEPDLEIHPAKQAAGARVMACFPLVVGNRPLGVLYVYLHEERPFSQVELLLLNNFVNQAAIAIYRAAEVAGIQRDLARKEDELSRLRRAALLISSRTSLEGTLQVILQMALDVTGARYGIFRLVDKSGQHLVMRAIAGEDLGRPAVEELPINATSVMGYVARLRQPVNIADVRLLPWSRIYYPLDHALEMRSELAVPLIGAGGRLEGVLNLESPHVAAFSEADSHLLQSLATQAVIAIQEARLLDALQQIAEWLLVKPAHEVLNGLVDLSCGLLNAGASAIWMRQGDRLSLAAANGGHVRGDDLLIHGSLTGQAVLTRAPVLSPDVRTDPRFSWPNLARGQGWTRALIVPLLPADGSEATGAFSVYGTEAAAGRFAASDWDQKVLTTLARYAALALQNASRQDALRAAQDARAVAETFAAMGDIAANLLHHLNNKVGAIPVRVEGIQDKCAAALAANHYLAANLAAIEQSALEAMAIVRERLSLLRPIERGLVDVASCVRDAVSAADLPAGVSVELAGLDRLPQVAASRETLAWAIINLLQNASDAMEGRGRIAITAAAQRPWIEILISDTGPGIAPDLQARIFEFSFSGARSEGRGKLGFGLWWVRTLISRLDGAIAVESDGRNGATFRVRLPIGNGPGGAGQRNRKETA